MALDASDHVVLVVPSQIGSCCKENARELANCDGGRVVVILHGFDIHAALIGYDPVARGPCSLVLLPAGFDLDWLELFTVPCHAVILGTGIRFCVLTYITSISNNRSYRRWNRFPRCFQVFAPSLLKAKSHICTDQLVLRLIFDEFFNSLSLGQLHFTAIESQGLVHVGVVRP